MLFSEVLGSLRGGNGQWTATVPEPWSQGRSLFGGLQSALALRAMRKVLPRHLPLRVLQTTFIAPVLPGEVHVTARVVREGKSAVHVEAHFVDGDQTLAALIGIFGAGRESQVHLLPRQPAVDAQSPVESRYHPGMPQFTRYFRQRWLKGSPPFTGVTLPYAVIEVGVDDSAVTAEEHVVAIADAIPPVALSHLTRPAPGSSMAWTLEMLRDQFDDLPLQGWRLDVEMLAARNGYINQAVMVWGPGGEPVALSRQCMVIFG